MITTDGPEHLAATSSVPKYLQDLNFFNVGDEVVFRY